jgi:hypothetical protein
VDRAAAPKHAFRVAVPQNRLSPRERKQWLVGALVSTSLFLGIGWAMVYYAPSALIPRFLQSMPSKTRLTIYNEGVHSVTRGGRILYLPQTLITENQSFTVRSPVEELIKTADDELTADNGWDLQANPQAHTAQYYQRTTNTTVSVHQEGNKSLVTVAQTRNATIADRIRKWWSDL